MLKPIRKVHDDKVRFTAAVLWIAGFSASQIGRVLWKSRASVLSLCQREFPERGSLTDDQRQAVLDDLRSLRFTTGAPVDGGLLDRFNWRILPMHDRRKRRAGTKPAADAA